MIYEKIRKAILKSAFLGKITEQLENDDNVEDIIIEIKKKKHKVSKKLSTNKSIEINKSENIDLDIIPSSWLWLPLEDICFKITDGSHNPPKNSGLGIPLLSAANIHHQSVNFHEATRYITEEDWASEDKRTKITLDDVLLTIVGTIGRTAVVKSNQRFALQRSVAVLTTGINPYYLAYYLSIKENYMYMAKGTAQQGIYLNTLKKLLIPIPPLAEQKRIVKKLEELLPLIDSLEKDELKLKDLMQQFPNSMTSSILLQAMEGKLVDQYPEDGKAINELKQILKIDNTVSLENELDYSFPENWELIELEKVCALSTGNSINQTVKKTKYSKKINGYSYIGTKDVNFDHTIDYNNGVYIPYDDSFRVAKSGSTLLCIEGGSAGRKIGLLDRDVCYGNKLVSIFPLYINPKFVFYFVKSPIFQIQFKENMTGMIGGVGINKIKKIYIPIPPLTVQKRIVEKLDQILPIVEKIYYEEY